MVKVKVASVKKSASVRSTKRDLYAMVAYYYPQYTFKEAENLKARDLNILIKTAQKLKAVDYLNLTQIVAAPHSEKGKAVDRLIDDYQSTIRKSTDE